ncbi:MAG: leucine-rich repeat protein [Bacteroidales bacterium]|nr:leucine-rich repeat protein [Candidatus Sodaliphilus fimicaballi]
MNMKITKSTWLRNIALGALCLMVAPLASAASITVDGINYSTSKLNATVAKYTIKKATATTPADTAFYTGDIIIPETFEYGGETYTVVATAANSFLDCKDMTSLVLPATCINIGRNSFKGCSSLKVSPIPVTATTIGTGALNGCSGLEELTIPVGWAGPMISEDLAGCSSLKKLIFADSATPFKMNYEAFGKSEETRVANKSIEEIYFGRDIDATLYANNLQPFHSMPALKKITFSGEATTIAGTMFQGCSALKEVVFIEGNKVASIGAAAFQSCASLEQFEVPAAVTTIADNTFNGCKGLAFINLGNITSIQNNAFYNTGLTTVELPASLRSIASQAFMKSKVDGHIIFPDGLTTIGEQAFAETKLTTVTIPASVANIGNAAFAPITTLASIYLDENNSTFKEEDGVLTTADGARLLVTGHQGISKTTLDAPAVTSIDNYGLAYSPYETVNVPAVATIGNNAFANAKVKSFSLKNGVSVGTNVFTKSALESIVIEEGRNEIPQGICNDCESLTSVTLPTTTTNIMQNAFANCPALESLEVPANVNYMEPGSVPATIKGLRVLNANVPVLANGVFTEAQNAVECKVAAASVESFKAAAQWQYLNIVADPTIVAGGSSLGCPTGLYFATKEGKLMYKDENGDVIDTQFETGVHPFSLASYKNRIYVADAGKRFNYQSPTAGAGDGQLFYVNNTDGIFYRVTVLNNVGYEAFQDPFSMAIDKELNKIYIADRNVGIHEMSADAVGLYGEQPFFFQNNWLPYYSDQWSYGAIGAGLTKTVDAEKGDVYWVGKKFNGFGIFRFRNGGAYNDIYPDGGAGKTQHFKPTLKGYQITTFYIDEKNGWLYFYLQADKENGTTVVPGIYRLPMQAIYDDDAKGDAAEGVSMAAATLVDNAPVLLEGSGDEVTGVTQITGDGENVYWAYIAPKSAEDACLPNCVAFDAENPLHKSGIKCVKVTDETQTVQYAVEDVEAYGVAGATYVPEPKPTVKGDINGDGVVDIADVNACIDMILGLQAATEVGDVNGDGNVDVADMNAIIDIVLGL